MQVFIIIGTENRSAMLQGNILSLLGRGVQRVGCSGEGGGSDFEQGYAPGLPHLSIHDDLGGHCSARVF